MTTQAATSPAPSRRARPRRRPPAGPALGILVLVLLALVPLLGSRHALGIWTVALIFAGVSSGLALPQRLLQGSLGTSIPAASHQGIPVLGAGHSGGARGNGIADQVNRSVQQGLRPLQSIGGR